MREKTFTYVIAMICLVAGFLIGVSLYRICEEPVVFKMSFSGGGEIKGTFEGVKTFSIVVFDKKEPLTFPRAPVAVWEDKHTVVFYREDK